MRGYRAQISVQYAAPTVEITRTMRCVVSIENTGQQTWRPTGLHAVSFSYHWYGAGKTIEGLRFALPAAVEPGEVVFFDSALPAPLEEGNYTLELDLVREHIAWFGNHGSPTVRLNRTATDYDYEEVYRQQDLDKDYWTVVGPTTREHYENIGREKRQHLIDSGLTPDSRVLDVGCGTGQLAEALDGYLSDNGSYCGTDLAQEAVTFCRRRFKRPNFTFVKNEMTSLPLEGRCFDVIVLASVFTHMYPAEIQAMLNELSQLLAPRGFIVADVFVTPHTKIYVGSRSRVELNESHLFERIGQTGLSCERKGRVVLPGGGKRLGLIFRKSQAAT